MVALAACRAELLGLAAWAHWCYALPSRLIFGEYTLDSSSGVQQGDALGPLLFSLALQPILRDIRSLQGIDVAFAYLDDVVLCGDDAAIKQAVEILSHRARGIGLELNFGKCMLTPTAGTSHTCNLEAYNENIQRNLTKNFKLLGAQLGDRTYCEDFT